jgi:hypothetical protein
MIGRQEDVAYILAARGTAVCAGGAAGLRDPISPIVRPVRAEKEVS